MYCLNTVDTTRVPYGSAVKMAVIVSRMVWPVAGTPDAPKVVILAPDCCFPYSYMASSLIHDPIKGTTLLTPPDELPPVVKREILRIGPTGTENVPPVITVGPIAPAVITEIENMGYPVLAIGGRTIFSTAANVAKLRSEVTPESTDGPMSLFIVAAETPYGGMPVPYYSSHTGVPILFTCRDKLPQATAMVLQQMADRFVYIVGDREEIDDHVIREINHIMLHPARRIAGADPFETAVAFSLYYDPHTKLGWNRNQKGTGDAFTFTNIRRWDLAIAAVTFSHQGKHTPLLLVEKNCIPCVVYDYLTGLKPLPTMPPAPPYMHGFVLGTTRDVSFDVQANLELAMKVDVPM